MSSISTSSPSINCTHNDTFLEEYIKRNYSENAQNAIFVTYSQADKADGIAYINDTVKNMFRDKYSYDETAELTHIKHFIATHVALQNVRIPGTHFIVKIFISIQEKILPRTKSKPTHKKSALTLSQLPSISRMSVNSLSPPQSPSAKTRNSLKLTQSVAELLHRNSIAVEKYKVTRTLSQRRRINSFDMTEEDKIRFLASRCISHVITDS